MTKTTCPPRPPVANFPNPSAEVKAGTWAFDEIAKINVRVIMPVLIICFRSFMI